MDGDAQAAQAPPPAQVAGTGYHRRRVDLRREQVVVEIERYRIQGALHLPAEGYRSRLSDYMNQREAEFLPMTDCTITTLETEQQREVSFLLVARRHVRLIAPIEPAEDNGA
jgi:hypothetical protein